MSERRYYYEVRSPDDGRSIDMGCVWARSLAEAKNLTFPKESHRWRHLYWLTLDIDEDAV